MGSDCNRHMCILLSVKHIWCSDFPRDLCLIGGGVGSVCNRYMCIILHVKLIGCNGVA